MKTIILILSIFICTPIVQAQTKSLTEQIRTIIRDKEAQVGVAVILNSKDTFTVNNNCRYPMLSVYKFHQALAVADYLNRNHLPLETQLYITQKDLHPDTYSPLRDKYPEGNISLPVSKLLEYTLQLSDNNACDILFNYTGGTEAADKYIRSLGLKEYSIRATEHEMHQDLDLCYSNWSTPLEAVRLLEIFLNRSLFANEYQEFIKRTMIECGTGKDRLPEPLLETKAIIGHKTGTSDRNARGEFIGINDIGFVCLPDGQHYSIAIFVKDSKESMSNTTHIIADISEVVYRYVLHSSSF